MKLFIIKPIPWPDGTIPDPPECQECDRHRKSEYIIKIKGMWIYMCIACVRTLRGMISEDALVRAHAAREELDK